MQDPVTTGCRVQVSVGLGRDLQLLHCWWWLDCCDAQEQQEICKGSGSEPVACPSSWACQTLWTTLGNCTALHRKLKAKNHPASCGVGCRSPIPQTHAATRLDPDQTQAAVPLSLAPRTGQSDPCSTDRKGSFWVEQLQLSARYRLSHG